MIRKKAKAKSKGQKMKSKSAASKRIKKASKKNPKSKSAKTALKKKAAGKRAASTRGSARRGRRARGEQDLTPDRRRRKTIAGMNSGAQTGDLQGVSRTQEADSESVEELVEEGNPFEAGAVAGVEEADNEDEREVHTHEVAEDDVPEEYLDQD